ncbi:MAG TPA: carboxymuconolactone decarboxylase family protein [Bryobacteraceae bacterium]|jgi:uncharacterized peroxidase-related enzyme|nr:carboxymuconolactone decarboxylase family protein [Bryobacteraceae bacterium]
MPYTIRGVEPETNAALNAIEKKSGSNNFLRVMARRPQAMEAFASFYATVMGSTSLLDRRLREMVYLAVATVNECAYCATHHRKAAEAAGISLTEIHEVEVETNEHFSPKEQAALVYARELTRTSLVSDDLRYRTQELFTDEEFIDLTMIIGLANFTNRFNNGLAVSLDVSLTAG